MLCVTRLLWVGLLCVGLSCLELGAARTARAGSQLFDASWTVKSFGNECYKADPTPGPHCNGITTGEFRFYQAYGMPQGILCNPGQPRCPFESTPTDGFGQFSPLGGSAFQALHCAPWFDWYGGGATMRPAKGQTVTPHVPPLYRNPKFFTPGGQPETYSCLGSSTDGFGGPGPVMIGSPVKGRWSATTTGTGKGGFQFGPAPATVPAGITKGVRATGVVGEFGPIYPYLYSYTYATLRNATGVFGAGKGPGSFQIAYGPGASVYASISVKQGSAKFGGTMRMLGALTTKVCYWLVAGAGGCSLGENDWRYESVGASAPTVAGVVTMGEIVTFQTVYYNTLLAQTSLVTVEGARFPWTTGSVTVTAQGRGPHKTIHYAQGFDNRTSVSGLGSIQLVSPVLTRWLAYVDFETAGVGILRINFLPEPHTWAMLVAGAALLGVGARIRRR